MVNYVEKLFDGEVDREDDEQDLECGDHVVERGNVAEQLGGARVRFG